MLFTVGISAAIVNEINDDDSSDTSNIDDNMQPQIPNSQTGTDGSDILTGGSGSDVIDGRAGDDQIRGNGSADILEGGLGDDTIRGGAGSDFVLGGEGDDELYGQAGDDLVQGGEGDDALIGTDLLNEDITIADLEAVANTGDLNNLPLSINDNPTDSGNQLFGGIGDDRFVLGDNDTATGGADNDEFQINNGITSGNYSTITDFSSTDDQITIRYAQEEGPPSVDVQSVGDDAVIFVDAQLVARLTGAAGTITTGDINLLAV